MTYSTRSSGEWGWGQARGFGRAGGRGLQNRGVEWQPGLWQEASQSNRLKGFMRDQARVD